MHITSITLKSIWKQYGRSPILLLKFQGCLPRPAKFKVRVVLGEMVPSNLRIVMSVWVTLNPSYLVPQSLIPSRTGI